MKHRTIDLAALAFAIFLAILAVSMVRCQSAPAEPAPAPFLGKWVDDSEPPYLFAVEFREDNSVTFSAREGAQLISQTDGDWSYKPPLLITRDKQCQAGPPLRLVPCPTSPDTVRVSITGDEWPISFFRDGEIISFKLRRVN